MAAAEARRAMERQPEPSISKPAPRAEAAAGAAPPLAVGGIAAQVAQDSRARAEADAALKSSTATIGIRGLSEEAERPAAASQAKPLAGPPAAAPSAPKPLADRPRVEERARPIEKKRALAWRGLEQEPPQKWLERLAELRKQGQTREADELLAEFKRRFPAHPLPVGTE
jgi:hypothetical protein